jgi:hypothetical protein
MKMEQIEGSETSAIRTKTPGNYSKENMLVYKNNFLASAMMLHDGDAISVETCSFVVETKNSLFQETEWHRTVASPWNSLCKNMYFTYLKYDTAW